MNSNDEAHQPKDAQPATRAMRAALRERLNFTGTQDFDNARRGLIAAVPDDGVVRNARGTVVWDLSAYGFRAGDEAIDTVNPSLLRMARRGQFQFGPLLAPGPRGQVDAGLGKVTARGRVTLITPTDVIKEPIERHVIDGVTIDFHLALGAVATDTLFDFMVVRLDAERAAGKRLSINWTLTDRDERICQTLRNETLTHLIGKQAADAVASLATTREVLVGLIVRKISVSDAVDSGALILDGERAVVEELFGLLDDFDLQFDVVTP